MNIQNYFIIVNSKYEVSKYFELSISTNTEVLIVIECKFERFSSTEQTSYFTNIVYDGSGNRIGNNTFSVEGITFTIHENEKWEKVVEPSHFGVSLSVSIIDKLNTFMEFKFNNKDHDGSAFILLLKYILELTKYSTHEAVNTIRKKDKEILKLEKSLFVLKKSLKT